VSETFRHEALLYATDDEYVAGTLGFIQGGLDAGDPVFVATSREKIDLLRSHLNGGSSNVRFADMHDIGLNPGAIISAWREFVNESAAPGREVWGVAEPVWPERSPAELVECHRHECLLNIAFADTPHFRLLCSYDTSALAPDVIERAHVSHPVIVDAGRRLASERYPGLAGLEDELGAPLPEPTARRREIAYTKETLHALRRFVLAEGLDAGLPARLADDLVLAVNELATNSVRHADGGGALRTWREGEVLVWEVRDRGWIADPLAGRQRPPRDDEGGYGLWMVNQLCELVQVRSSDAGTVIRLYVHAGRPVSRPAAPRISAAAASRATDLPRS
jgi:anti-sigma regulatory factor (Ser/Thr protein kinase)